MKGLFKNGLFAPVNGGPVSELQLHNRSDFQPVLLPKQFPCFSMLLNDWSKWKVVITYQAGEESPVLFAHTTSKELSCPFEYDVERRDNFANMSVNFSLMLTMLNSLWSFFIHLTLSTH